MGIKRFLLMWNFEQIKNGLWKKMWFRRMMQNYRLTPKRPAFCENLILIGIAAIIIIPNILFSQPFQPQRIHYSGGGDWYGNKTTWENILRRLSVECNMETAQKEVWRKISDPDFFERPFSYISGHGNIYFSDDEAQRLRLYLSAGGFLYADDDYGMDKAFRNEMKKVFPELKFTPVPFSHPIYHNYFQFKNGLPKIHEHEGGPPQGLALIYQGRMVCFYSYNTDISDGCEDEGLHNDPPQKREQAIQMAINIVLYALQN
jgi:hypothetical protein